VFVALGIPRKMRLLIVMWPVWLYIIFPHYLIKGTIIGKTDIENKIVF
jgi:hypothetical protein